jgi:hypothetical protein
MRIYWYCIILFVFHALLFPFTVVKRHFRVVMDGYKFERVKGVGGHLLHCVKMVSGLAKDQTILKPVWIRVFKLSSTSRRHRLPTAVVVAMCL